MLLPFMTINAQGGPVYAANEIAQAAQAGSCGFRTNATLRKDEWKELETALVTAYRSRIIGVADLKSRGLVKTIANGLWTTVLEEETVGNMGRAQMSMDAEEQPQEDQMLYGIRTFPLPIFSKDFSFNERVLGASRARGQSIDATHTEEAGVVIAEEQEMTLFLGSNSFGYGGGVVYGYTDHPSRVTGTITDWNATGADPVEDIIAMKGALNALKVWGPFVVYIPGAYEKALDRNYVTGAAAVNITVRERIMKIGNIEDIKVADFLTAGSVVMVQMNTSTIRMVSGMPLQMRQWTVGAGMRKHFKGLTIDIPQLRTDKNGVLGVAHYSV